MEDNGQAITTSRTLSVLNFIFGAWLIVSPYILGYVTAQARWEQTVAGIIVAIMAAIHYFAPRQVWTAWVNLIVGAWMVIAPFATGYQASVAFWNEIIFGILIGLAALGNLGVQPSTSYHRPHPMH